MAAVDRAARNDMAGNPESPTDKVNRQRLGPVQQTAIDNVVIPAYLKNDIGIPGLIQSQTEFGRTSSAGIKNDADR
jgi:hypothetical protein